MESNRLKPTDGLKIHGWMVTHLALTGPELFAYALVHQFSQSKAGIYTGGVPYLAAWLGCSLNSARKYLHNLTDRGFIIEDGGTKAGVPYKNYQVAENHIPKILEDTPKKLEGNTQKFEGYTPKNFGVEYNKESNKEVNNITLPFNSEKFRETWAILVQQPKWKKKSEAALRMSLKKLAAHTEAEAIEMMQTSIANDWQGLFEPDRKRAETKDRYYDQYHINEKWGMK